MRERHDSHDGIATLAVKKVADTREYGVVIHGADGRVQGFQEKPEPAEALSDLGNCGIYMFRREIFDYFPEEPFVDWAMDVFPRLLESEVSFYVHEFDDYWNDIGSLDEYRQGNFDALAGAAQPHLRGRGGRRRHPLGRHRVAGGHRGHRAGAARPRLRDRGGAWLHGPLVVGDGARIGEGAKLRETVVLPGAEVPAGTALAGAIVLDELSA